jgi:hypothetical protein
LSYINCKSAGQSGTNRTTQAEISNLLRLSYPGRVTRSYVSNAFLLTKLVSKQPGNYIGHIREYKTLLMMCLYAVVELTRWQTDHMPVTGSH